MTKMRGWKRLLSILLVGILCFGSVITVSADELSDAQAEQRELEKQKKEAQSAKDTLNNSLKKIVAEMSTAEKKLDEKQVELMEAQDELDLARINEHQQYDSMKKRIKFMYENGNTEFIEILCESQNISDLLNKAEYIKTISTYDRNMLKEFQKVVEEVETKEKKLKEEEAELIKIQNELLAKQNEVEALLSKTDKELSDLKGEIGTNAAKIKRLIAKAEAAKRQQQSGSAGGGGKPGASQIIGNGQLAWPTTSTRVTSTFGWRAVPVAGATAYHDAIDIGVANGSPVYAADSGTVILASYGYNGGRGVYVMVDHGNGMVTRYQHLNSIYVSVGQKVSRGQNIAASGNTGASSGPHLDFAVIVNGTAVNPLNYL